MSDSNTVYKILSSEIKSLASRISKQDELIAVLQSEIVRLSSGGGGSSSVRGGAGRDEYRPPHRGSVPFRGGIPLTPSAPASSTSATATAAPGGSKPLVKRVRPAIAATEGKPSGGASETTPLPLSDVLKKDEVVTVEVGLTRYEDGTFSNYATCGAKFDGTDLNVTECDLAGEMVGFKTSKPGEILYRFMDALIKGKHIKGKFACPPWKLCSVVRDGAKVTLDELRAKLGGR
jgi:hypothetical protein